MYTNGPYAIQKNIYVFLKKLPIIVRSMKNYKHRLIFYSPEELFVDIGFFRKKKNTLKWGNSTYFLVSHISKNILLKELKV